VPITVVAVEELNGARGGVAGAGDRRGVGDRAPTVSLERPSRTLGVALLRVRVSVFRGAELLVVVAAVGRGIESPLRRCWCR